MRKHLSLILMALVAGAMMFTSCGKEQYTITVGVNDASMGSATGGGKYNVNTEVTLTATPNTGYDFVKWSDGNTDNPRTVVVTADAEYTAIFQRHVVDGTTISFNGNTWTAANMTGYDYSSQGYLAFEIFKTANSTSDVNLLGWLESTPGSYDYASTYDYFKYYDPNDTYYDEDGALSQDGSAGTYYRWQILNNESSFVENVTAVDLNNKSISATWSEELYDVEDYIAAGNTVPDRTYTLTGQMVNATWVWGQTSKAAQKVKDSKFLVVR